MNLPPILKTIAKELSAKSAKAILVGGSVRDYYLGLPSKDYDVEVFGLASVGELEALLSHYGNVNIVGKSFGVLKFGYEGEEYDFSFPRRESKNGVGHKGFDIEVDGTMSFKDAAHRRDFTMNAMGYDIEAKSFLDPFGGVDDINNSSLRHVNSKSFVEDPLRVYRAIQFSARFDVVLDVKTFELCREMVESGMLENLAQERVLEEFKKLLLKSPSPSLGFELMHSLGVLKYFPELEAIMGVIQSPKWHPEGDVWVHTMMAVDAMVSLLGDDRRQNLIFMFAILCHDFGKATTTIIDKDGRIRSTGHEKSGIEPTEKFLYRLTNEHDFIKKVLPLVEHHLKPSQLFNAKAKSPAIRRLATKVNIEELIVVAKADFLGRTTQESLLGIYEAGKWLLQKAKSLKVQNSSMDNLIQGRDLIALGMKPSPKFKEILDEVYSLQLDGKITSFDEAIEYVKNKEL